jgi:argininosuccinate lyase
MPQKRNPCSLEVVKAKTSFAHGVVVSLLSAGKALFMGYNRDTQWTKYWVMDLVEESKPTLSVMTEIIRLLRVNEAQMFEQARKEFAGATSLMEWMVRHGSLPLRKAKMVMEKAVKYSEREGREEVSYGSLKKALEEMKIRIQITEQDVKKIQKPERILAQLRSIGTPSAKAIRRNMAWLQGWMTFDKHWLILNRRKIEKAKGLVSRMEKAL